MPDNAQSRAEQADYLLNHPLFDGCFRELGEFYNQAWFATQEGDEAIREKLWLKLQVLKEIKQTLVLMVQTGQAAQEMAKL